MLNFADIFAVIFGVLMAWGGWYVYKMAELYKGWQYIWRTFTVFLLFLSGSRFGIDIFYAPCPEGVFAIFLHIGCPLIGALAFVYSMKRLYQMFATGLGSDFHKKEGQVK